MKQLIGQGLMAILFFKSFKYRVFIKYCVFPEDFKIFRILAFLCLSSVSVCVHNGPNNEGLIPIRLLSYRFGLAGLEYLNHKCVCFLP